MPFDATKKAQLETRVNNTLTQLANVEQTLLSGARDATVQPAERFKCYELLRSIQLMNDALAAILTTV